MYNIRSETERVLNEKNMFFSFIRRAYARNVYFMAGAEINVQIKKVSPNPSQLDWTFFLTKVLNHHLVLVYFDATQTGVVLEERCIYLKYYYWFILLFCVLKCLRDKTFSYRNTVMLAWHDQGSNLLWVKQISISLSNKIIHF